MNRRLFLALTDKRSQRLLLLAALWVPALVVLVLVREVLLPFFLAAALAYVILPPVRWLSSKRVAGRTLPRWAAVIVLYALTLVVVGGGARVFVPQIYKELSRLGHESAAALDELSDENIARKAVSLETWVEQSGLPIRIVTAEDEDEGSTSSTETGRPGRPGALLQIDLRATMQDAVRRARAAVLEEAMAAVSRAQVAVAIAVRFVFSGLLVLMLTAFLVADSERVVGFVHTLAPVRDRARFVELLERIDRGLSGVVRGQLTICLANGVLTLVGLLLLKVKFAFLLAIVAAVFSLVPIFGSILSTIPIVIVALSSGLSTAVLAVLWIIGIHLLEANLLNPKIMGDAAKIHPVIVVLALVIGEHYGGLAGALFAVPITSVCVTVWKAARGRAMRLDEEIVAHEDDAHRGGGASTFAADGAPGGPRPGRRLRGEGG